MLPAPARIVSRGFQQGVVSSTLELFRGDVRLHLARWPNDGYDTATYVGPADSSADLTAAVRPETVARWSQEKALWIGGYPGRAWAFDTTAVNGFEPESGRLALAPFAGRYKTRNTFRYFAFNALSELDRVDEYVLDPASQKVHLLADPAAGPIEVAVTRSLLEVRGASHIIVENVALERALGDLVRIENSAFVTLRDCLVRNGGGRGIVVTDGSSVRVERCVVSETAETGVELEGGDRTTLTPAGHLLVDSIIARFGLDGRTYRPGVQVRGVGNTVRGSLIRGGPHMGIGLGGNDHRIEGNELAALVTETDDAGAIYMSRDWTARGNVIAGNFLHDIGASAPAESFIVGVYLDDQSSGVELRANVFLRVSRPIVIGGGRDNLLERNSFLLPGAGHAAVWLDARGRNWQRGMVETGILRQRLERVPYRIPPYSERYPTMVNLLEDEPGAPKGNRLMANTVVGGALLDLERGARSADVTQSDTILMGDSAQVRELRIAAPRTLDAMIRQVAPLDAIHVRVADRATALAGLLHRGAVGFLGSSGREG